MLGITELRSLAIISWTFRTGVSSFAGGHSADHRSQVRCIGGSTGRSDAACGWRPKRAASGAVASVWWPRRPGFLARRFTPGLQNWVVARYAGAQAPGIAQHRVRAPGGGRKRLASTDPTLLQDLDALVEPTTRGDPRSALRWTSWRITLAQGMRRAGRPLKHVALEVGYGSSSALMRAFLREIDQPLAHWLRHAAEAESTTT